MSNSNDHYDYIAGMVGSSAPPNGNYSTFRTARLFAGIDPDTGKPLHGHGKPAAAPLLEPDFDKPDTPLSKIFEKTVKYSGIATIATSPLVWVAHETDIKEIGSPWLISVLVLSLAVVGGVVYNSARPNTAKKLPSSQP